MNGSTIIHWGIQKNPGKAKTPLKSFWTSLQYPQNTLQTLSKYSSILFETLWKLSWNLEIHFKLPWDLSITPLELPWHTCTSIKYSWHTHKIPLRQLLIFFEASLKHPWLKRPWNILYTSIKLPKNILANFLKRPVYLLITFVFLSISMHFKTSTCKSCIDVLDGQLWKQYNNSPFPPYYLISTFPIFPILSYVACIFCFLYIC